MIGSSFRHATLVSAAVAAFVLSAAAPSAAGSAASAESRGEGTRMRDLQNTAREVEARISASEAERAALVAAKTDAEVRAVLLRNGFTEAQLGGVKVRKMPGRTNYQARTKGKGSTTSSGVRSYQARTAGGPTLSIRITVKCCWTVDVSV